jgi:hypothetical protein
MNKTPDSGNGYIYHGLDKDNCHPKRNTVFQAVGYSYGRA